MSPNLFPTSVNVSLSKKNKSRKVLDTLAKLFTICKNITINELNLDNTSGHYHWLINYMEQAVLKQKEED